MKSRVGEIKRARFHVVARWVCTGKKHAGGLGLIGRKLMLSPRGQLETRNTKEMGSVS